QDTDVLANTYSYQMRSATEAYISQQVKTETIKYGSSTVNRSYKYDVLGRVTTITDSIFGSHNYSYNARGFLEQEDTTKYEYDSNGNITKAGSITFTYDSAIKDKLKTVNGKAITYDENNPFNPKSYNGNTYTFEGRRLVKYNNYKYTYDDQGLRTSKTIDSTITNYYYEGDLLITEDKPGCRLDFLYDENNQLYGFIYNSSVKYFYVKDILSNILGIVDSQGNLVVQYKYTAYGTKVSITGSYASTIGAYNPFRWKGYYYDNESGLYLVTTRILQSGMV
ncbi:MAG: hypothetical protein K2H06_01710, partial [Anaeroplasmataceae bacterium]|nr:hypothetical protein [Anaeroplasmataceae bacterium]